VLFLRETDSAPFRDDIVNACLHNEVYDNQVNGDRPEYLFDVVRASTDEHNIRNRLIDSMAHVDGVGDGWMVSTLVRMFAQEGDHEARQALFASVQRNPEDHPALGRVIELDGMDGLVFVAECLGDRGSSDPGYSDNDVLLANAIDRFGEDMVWQTLDARSTTSGQVALFTSLARQRREWRSSNPRPNRSQPGDTTFDELRDRVGDPQASQYFFQRWGMGATEVDLLRAAEDLVTIADDDVVRLVRYLRIFRLRPFPLSHTKLLGLYASGNEDVRRGATAALAKIQHPDVRELGLRLTTSDDPWLRCQALDLLNANPQPGDHELVEAVVDRATDEIQLHSIGMSIITAAGSTHSKDLSGALLKVYEKGPCAYCRQDVVKALIALETLPQLNAEECLFDQNLDTRELARQYLAP
jgi:hypothetical protein